MTSSVYDYTDKVLLLNGDLYEQHGHPQYPMTMYLPGKAFKMKDLLVWNPDHLYENLLKGDPEMQLFNPPTQMIKIMEWHTQSQCDICVPFIHITSSCY